MVNLKIDEHMNPTFPNEAYKEGYYALLEYKGKYQGGYSYNFTLFAETPEQLATEIATKRANICKELWDINIVFTYKVTPVNL